MVTISLACFRGFPWRKVPIYVLAQSSTALAGGGPLTPTVLGAMTGAAIIYGLYHETINVYANGQLTTVGDMATGP